MGVVFYESGLCRTSNIWYATGRELQVGRRNRVGTGAAFCAVSESEWSTRRENDIGLRKPKGSSLGFEYRLNFFLLKMDKKSVINSLYQ